jgi:hypothetical protein
MIFSLNCLFLGEASSRSIPVIISEEIIVGNNRIQYKDITVSNVKSLFLSEKGVNYSSDNLNLWKVDRVSVDKNDMLLETFSTENDIKEKLGGELMIPRFPLSKYFNGFEDDESKFAIHIIVQLLTTTTGKCLPMVYLSNKKFAVTIGLIFFSRPSQQGVPQGTVSK